MPAPFRLLLITDRAVMRPSLVEAVDLALSALPPGAAAVQLRERDLDAGPLLALARALVPVCEARGARLLINDRLDVAKAAGAHGVHLRSRSVPVADAQAFLGPGALVGVSCHSRAEVEAARGAAYVTLGPVFATPSKRGLGEPLGLEGFSRALDPAGPPAIALGGVTLSTARLVLGAGASGVAAIRAFWERDPASQAARMWAILQP
jgi:thiamine-phosphate pyrophosphorylase